MLCHCNYKGKLDLNVKNDNPILSENIDSQVNDLGDIKCDRISNDGSKFSFYFALLVCANKVKGKTEPIN